MHFMHKSAVLFLILCLQFQAAAAIVMPCAHQDGTPAAEAMVGCHQAETDAGPLDGRSHFSCIKCALGCISGSFQVPMLGSSLNGAVPYQTVNQALTPQHYYRFVPDHPQRPPIV